MLVVFVVIVIAVLMSTIADIAMRIELSEREVPGEKLSWWGLRGGDQVPDTYKEIFPKSRLPLVRNIPFYLVICLAAIALIAALLKSR